MEERVDRSERTIELADNTRGSTFWDFTARMSESRKVRYALYFILFIVEESVLGFFNHAIFFDHILPFIAHYYLMIPAFVLLYFVGTRIFARWGRSKGVIVDDIRSDLSHTTWWIGEKKFRELRRSGALVPLSSGIGVNRYWAYDCELDPSGYPRKLRFALFHHLSPANVHYSHERYNKSLQFIDKLYDAVSLSALNSSLAGRIHANEAFKQYDAALRDASKISELPFKSVEAVVRLMDEELDLEVHKVKKDDEEVEE